MSCCVRLQEIKLLNALVMTGSYELILGKDEVNTVKTPLKMCVYEVGDVRLVERRGFAKVSRR